MGQYNILNLAKGTLLKATHVKHIEDGVFDAHNELNLLDERLTVIEESDSSEDALCDLSYTEL